MIFAHIIKQPLKLKWYYECISQLWFSKLHNWIGHTMRECMFNKQIVKMLNESTCMNKLCWVLFDDVYWLNNNVYCFLCK